MSPWRVPGLSPAGAEPFFLRVSPKGRRLSQRDVVIWRPFRSLLVTRCVGGLSPPEPEQAFLQGVKPLDMHALYRLLENGAGGLRLRRQCLAGPRGQAACLRLPLRALVPVVLQPEDLLVPALSGGRGTRPLAAGAGGGRAGASPGWSRTAKPCSAPGLLLQFLQQLSVCDFCLGLGEDLFSLGSGVWRVGFTQPCRSRVAAGSASGSPWFESAVSSRGGHGQVAPQSLCGSAGVATRR